MIYISKSEERLRFFSFNLRNLQRFISESYPTKTSSSKLFCRLWDDYDYGMGYGYGAAGFVCFFYGANVHRRDYQIPKMTQGRYLNFTFHELCVVKRNLYNSDRLFVTKSSSSLSKAIVFVAKAESEDSLTAQVAASIIKI